MASAAPVEIIRLLSCSIRPPSSPRPGWPLPRAVSGRAAQAVAGDFFQTVPEGDAHILSFVIHDWDDERSVAILRNVHRAQPKGGRLFLVEIVLPEGNEPSFGKLLDMEMLVMPGGRERTRAEYASLFEAAGFRLVRVLATESPCSIIEAVRVD